jgi:hypothetical protein
VVAHRRRSVGCCSRSGAPFGTDTQQSEGHRASNPPVEGFPDW